MKTLSSSLLAHLAQDVTTLATCWRITRRDGVVMRFTDHDRDITVAGEACLPRAAYTRSAIAGDASLAVAETEVLGLLTDLDVTEADVRAGLWDYAAVRIF